MAAKSIGTLCVALLIVTVGACSKGGDLLGEPGDAAAVDRVVDITASDQLRFDPSEIDVEVGETIEFRITNDGKSDHEFALGSAGHEHSGSMEHSDPSSTGPISSGDSASLVWNFSTAGEVSFACHIAGHNKQGMTGIISIAG